MSSSWPQCYVAYPLWLSSLSSKIVFITRHQQLCCVRCWKGVFPFQLVCVCSQVWHQRQTLGHHRVKSAVRLVTGVWVWSTTMVTYRMHPYCCRKVQAMRSHAPMWHPLNCLSNRFGLLPSNWSIWVVIHVGILLWLFNNRCLAKVYIWNVSDAEIMHLTWPMTLCHCSDSWQNFDAYIPSWTIHTLQ